MPAATLAEVLAETVAGDERGLVALRHEQAARGDADAEERRLRVLGERQLILGAFEAQPAERLAQCGVRFGERLAADRKRLGERPAHADLLRTLSGKDEGAGGIAQCETPLPLAWIDTAAISRASRSMNWFATKR